MISSPFRLYDDDWSGQEAAIPAGFNPSQWAQYLARIARWREFSKQGTGWPPRHWLPENVAPGPHHPEEYYRNLDTSRRMQGGNQTQPWGRPAPVYSDPKFMPYPPRRNTLLEPPSYELAPGLEYELPRHKLLTAPPPKPNVIRPAEEPGTRAYQEWNPESAMRGIRDARRRIPIERGPSGEVIPFKDYIPGMAGGAGLGMLGLNQDNSDDAAADYWRGQPYPGRGGQSNSPFSIYGGQ